ncbi:MAG: spore protease YyaC [Peptococcaceae bacterium]|nr:spore protease YyaC [Peptococcaceae bacterium]
MGGGVGLSWGAVWSNLRSGEAKVHVDSTLAAEDIGKALATALKSRIHHRSDLVVVCIGTDRSTGDSLGPITGTLLKEKSIAGITVYGSLEHPVHATNLSDTVYLLSERHRGAHVIAVDACLGKADSVGVVTVGLGSLRPGAGVNKELPAIGEVYITGVVNVGGFMEYFVLQNTRLFLVYKLAETIANGIQQGLHNLELSKLKA